jgi:DNA repair exonuclease SbcCD ATPase subunit
VKTIAPAAILLAISITGGCSLPPPNSESEKARKDADARAERARREERQLRESAKAAMDARLAELENRIKALKAEWRPTANKAQRDIEEQVKILELETKELRERLSILNDKTTDAWNKLKESTESGMAKLERRIDELRSDIKNKKKK